MFTLELAHCCQILLQLPMLQHFYLREITVPQIELTLYSGVLKYLTAQNQSHSTKQNCQQLRKELTGVHRFTPTAGPGTQFSEVLLL